MLGAGGVGGGKAESDGTSTRRSSSDERAYSWDSVIRRGDAFRHGPKMAKILQVNMARELAYEVVEPCYPGDSK